MTTVEIRYNDETSDSLESVAWLVGMFDEIGTLRMQCPKLDPFPNAGAAYNPRTQVSSLYIADATTSETVRGVSDLISVFRHGNTLKSVHINTVELPEEEWEGLYSLMKSGLGAELTHLGLMVIWPDPDREREDIIHWVPVVKSY